MAAAKTEPQSLGYSLHLKASELVQEFRRNVDENFKWLNEILAEAKTHFGRRDSIALLPKTPCMKRKRKHTHASPENNGEDTFDASCPVADVPTSDIQTPECKKPTIRSPLSEVNESLDTKKQQNVSKNASKKKPARASKRQQPKRGAKNSKNAIQVMDWETDELNDNRVQPTRLAKGKRKQNSQVLLEVETDLADTEEETKTPIVQENRSNINSNKEEIQVKSIESTSGSRLPNVILLSPNEERVLAHAEVFIPETPEARTANNSQPTKKELSTKPCKVSVDIVMSSPIKPLSVIQETTETTIDNLTENQPVIVEVLPQEDNAPKSVLEVTRKRKSEVSPELRRSKRLTTSSVRVSGRGSSGRGSLQTKRRNQASFDEEDEEIHLVTTSTPVHDSGHPNVCTTVHKNEDNPDGCTANNEDNPDKTEAASDKDIVSSTVPSPDKRGSYRLSSKRRSSSSPQTPKRQRKSKQKSLVKSSIKVRLAQQPMPPLTPTGTGSHLDERQESDDDMQDTEQLRVVLFADEADGNQGDQHPENRVASAVSSTSSTVPLFSSGGSTCSTGSSEQVGDEGEEEVFHDASEHLHEDDDKEEEIQRPQTRTSPRLQNRQGDQAEGTASESSSSFSGDEDNDTHDSTQSSLEEPSVESNTGTGHGRNQPKNIVAIHSFIQRNTPKKVDSKEKNRQLKKAMREKAEKEKERIELLEAQRQRKIDEQKRKRKEREERVAGLRAAQEKEKEERKKQLEQKNKLISTLTEKAKKKREQEEEAKRRARLQKKADLDARRRQEEEARKQKLLEQEEEAKRYQDLLQRKQEFEDQERQKKIMETKRLQELREQDAEREREMEKARKLREIEEKERRAKEEKAREEREKEEREKKRITQMLKEKAEQERRERELKAREEKYRQDRERKLREEREKALQLQKEKERNRILEERLKAEQARHKALPDIDSYEMTPPPPPRVRSVTTGDNYNIDEICSDDSTDDEDAPRKKIPGWAQGIKLRATLMNQEMNHIDTRKIFGVVEMPNLSDIFQKTKKKRFYQRTSSAHWDSPPLKVLNRGTFV